VRIVVEQEEDGRWTVEITDLSRVMLYGPTKEEPIRKVKALGSRVLADQVEPGEKFPELDRLFPVLE
jgi:predicted RNase H-like HicB family nuclease